MRFRFLPLFAAVLPVILSAQEAPGGKEFPESEDGRAALIFPLAQVLEGAEFAGDGNRAWRPDWPPELPPDAFKVQAGEISRAALERDGLSLALSFDPDGRVKEFPFMLNGGMAQARLAYRDSGEIAEMELAFPYGEPEPEEAPAAEKGPVLENSPWKLEFLEYRDSYPSLARAFLNGDWFFVSLFRSAREITETWYGENGEALGAYGFTLFEIDGKKKIREVRDYSRPEGGMRAENHYDSRGFIVEASGPGGVYKVLYFREDLPRYWERRPESAGEPGQAPAESAADGEGAGNFTLQWDEAGFLVRLSSPGADESGNGFMDCRYEYILDERGNWIERREIRMLRSFGLLVPSPGHTVKRVLEYVKQE